MRQRFQYAAPVLRLRRKIDSKRDARLPWIAINSLALLTFVISSIMIWHLVSSRTWNPLFSEGLPEDDYGRGPFFTAQAISLLQGRLSVPPETLYGECFYVEGECFGYFGLTPSLLRLPLVLVGINLDLTSLSMIFGSIVGIGASLSIFLLTVHWYAPRPEVWGLYGGALFLLGLLAFGPGNLLFQLHDSRMFSEAVVWATAFLLSTLLVVLLWQRGHKDKWLVCAVIMAILAANARPSAAVSAAGISAALGLYMWRSSLLNRRRSVALFCLAVLPGSLLTATYIWKFGAPIPDLLMNESISGEGPIETRDKWQNVMRANGGTTFSLSFVPSQLWAALRPDAVVVNFTSPRNAFFGNISESAFTYVPPTPFGGLYVQPTGSLTTLATGPVVLSVIALVVTLSRSPHLPVELRWLIGVAVGSGAGLALTWTTVGVANRYLLDAWPLLVLAGSVGITSLLILKSKHPLVRILVVAFVTLSVGAGMFLNRMVTGL